MKRLDLIIYQLVLSAILVSFGILFELKSVDNTPYVSTVFLTIPGSVILFGTAFSHIKKMNFKKSGRGKNVLDIYLYIYNIIYLYWVI